MRIPLPFLITLFAFITGPLARAADALPYSDRTHPFGAASPTVRGDIRTVGMAGANSILGDTFLSAFTNPAGLAMTLSGVDTTFTSDTIFDAEIQNFDSPIHVNSIGVAASAYPWGFSMGYRSPYREEQLYFLTGPADTANLDVTTRELQFTAARVFFENRLSIGVSLTIGQAERAIEFSQSTSLNAAFHSYSVGGGVGVLYQLPDREMLGLSYQLPLRYSGTGSDQTAAAGVNNFFQDVASPATLTGGYGWIPNRFFRSAVTLEMIDATMGAALMGNDGIQIGQRPTLQPHLGAAYILAEFKEFEATAFLGSYWEKARVEGAYSRLHGTIGLETKLWIINVGGGVDIANGYRNYLLGIGVDIFKLAGKLDLVPQNWKPPTGGLFPAPFHMSDEGLARPLVADWRPHMQDLNPIEMGLEIPKRIQEKVESAGEAIKKALGAEPEVKPVVAPDLPPPPVKKVKRRKGRRKARKTEVGGKPSDAKSRENPSP